MLVLRLVGRGFEGGMNVGRRYKVYNVNKRVGRRTVSQMVTCESTGYPVQPAYCSSPNDLTIIGLSNVPIIPQ